MIPREKRYLGSLIFTEIREWDIKILHLDSESFQICFLRLTITRMNLFYSAVYGE